MAERTESRPVRHQAAGEAGKGVGAELHDLTAEYIRVAVVLAVVTLIEVATYYVALARGLTIGVLLVLSALKFSLVVLYFMHLKFEGRLLKYVFSGPLLLAVVVVIALMALFGVLIG